MVNDMEIFFNELSYSKETSSSSYKSILSVYTKLKEYNINICRVSSEVYAKIIYDLNLSNDRNILCGLCSFLQAPYEDVLDNETEDEYLNHTWKCNEEFCYGIALAHIFESCALSLDSAIWNSNILKLSKDGRIFDVVNFSTLDSVRQNQDWLENLKDIVLIETDKNISDKSIKLRDDHGKDKLKEFCNKLVNNPYVVGVLNSLPFNPHITRFIKEVKYDGVIEIVLPWTSKGLGIAVLTTGRNFRETKKIAEILEEKYGHI